MKKDEIKKMAEEMISNQCEESGLSKEEVLEVSTFCFLEKYIHDEISREDLITFSEYLETPLNMEEVDKLKIKRKKQARYRLNHKAKKLLERRRAKIGSGVRFKGNGLDKAVIQSLIEDNAKGKISDELLEIVIELTGLKKEDVLRKEKK